MQLARLRSPLLLTTVMMLALFIAGAATIQGFSSRFSIISMLILASFLGIASAGQTMVIVLGGIDLSVPFLIDFGDVVAGQLYGQGWPFWLIIALLLVLAALIGLFNGAISNHFHVHPLIVTLGTGFAVQGAVLLWNGGLSTGSSPDWLTSFVSTASTTGPLPLPPLILIWAAVSLLVLMIMRLTSFGRKIYALGSNPDAARLALVKPTPMWAATFMISALCSTLAGVFLLGFTGSVFASVGDPYMFLTIGAVVVGGTSLLGGRGGYAGTIVGAFMLIELTTILVGLGLSQALIQGALGAIILLVVSLYGREPHLRTRI